MRPFPINQLTAGLVVLLATFWIGQTALANDAECTAYAQEAVQGARINQQLGCGFEGARWSADEGLHYGYCIDRKGRGVRADISYESDARSQALQDCRARLNSGGGVAGNPPRGDMIVGTFGEMFCGAPATFEVNDGDTDTWEFNGMISIRDTGEYDRLRITQYSDNSLRIIRYLSGDNRGKRQTVRTSPPKFYSDGSRVTAKFESSGGAGVGCNNDGAVTTLTVTY